MLFRSKIMQDVEALNQEIRAVGAWVFAGGLQPPDTARVLRGAGAEVLSTDGRSGPDPQPVAPGRASRLPSPGRPGHN